MLASAAHILKLEQYREDGCIREAFHILGGFPGGLDGKESACNAGELGSIPGLGISSEGGHSNPLPVFLPGQSPWREGPGGLQFKGLQRVGHDWATKHMITKDVGYVFFKR